MRDTFEASAARAHFGYEQQCASIAMAGSRNTGVTNVPHRFRPTWTDKARHATSTSRRPSRIQMLATRLVDITCSSPPFDRTPAASQRAA